MSSTQSASSSSEVAEAYDALAATYDVLTADYCHRTWLQKIEEHAVGLGLCGHRLLDLGCGTGKSFLPLLDRGYEVTAVDISEQMAKIARCKAPSATVHVADMCVLARIGQFDLITCLDDAVNYLLTVEQLDAFFDSAARNLAPGGVLVFDVNALLGYRDGFSKQWLADTPTAFIGWCPRADAELASGGRASATVHSFVGDGPYWRRSRSKHEQRHWPSDSIREAAAQASLRLASICGQRPGAVIEPVFDEAVHHKALFFACYAESEVAE